MDYMKKDFMPRTKLGKRTMVLGLIAIFSGPILGVFGAVISPMIDRATSENTGRIIGFGVGAAISALCITALVTGIRAYKQGERSMGFWIGFVPAILAAGLFILMIIGEFIFPH